MLDSMAPWEYLFPLDSASSGRGALAGDTGCGERGLAAATHDLSERSETPVASNRRAFLQGRSPQAMVRLGSLADHRQTRDCFSRDPPVATRVSALLPGMEADEGDGAGLSGKPLCASIEGFSLHAAQAVGAQDREALERLLRSGLRAVEGAPGPLVSPETRSRIDGSVKHVGSRAPGSRMPWAQLLRRVLHVDSLSCPICSSRLREDACDGPQARLRPPSIRPPP